MWAKKLRIERKSLCPPVNWLTFKVATLFRVLAKFLKQPYIGIDLLQWVWGDFAVDNATFNRLFTFHFLIPFIIVATVITHLLFLHQTGSNDLKVHLHRPNIVCKHSKTFENVLKRSRTLPNMHKGLLFTPPEPHLRAVVLKHSTLFPPWHPYYRQSVTLCDKGGKGS